MKKATYNSNEKYGTFYNGKVQHSNLYRLPNYYGIIEDVEIFLENEKINLMVTKTGDVVFINDGGSVVAEAVVEPKTRNNTHEDAFLRVQDKKVYLYFSVMDYKDNYPNCDGEHDRWTSVCIGYDCLIFDILSNRIETRSVSSIYE